MKSERTTRALVWMFTVMMILAILSTAVVPVAMLLRW